MLDPSHRMKMHGTGISGVSCPTELENSFPTHLVCAWLKNSPADASRHYLRVTDRHFEQAIGGGGAPGGVNHPEVVQNKTGHGRTKWDTVKGGIDSKPPVSLAKPIKNATPSNNLKGGVQCFQKEYNTHEKREENGDFIQSGA